MPPEPSQTALALNLEFVADISYNPRTNQYRIDLIEPYCSELPTTHNFLVMSVNGFTVDKLLELFDSKVVQFYGDKYEAARNVLVRVRQNLNATDNHNEIPLDR